MQKLKSASLKAFVEKHKTTTFPSKQIYTITGFIDEDIDISTHHVLLKLPLTNPHKPSKLFRISVGSRWRKCLVDVIENISL